MIYIQSTDDKSRPHHFDCASAMFGAIETGQDYKLKSYEDLISGKLDPLLKTNLFVGSVEFMQEVFRRVGLNNVRLPANSNRESQIITLSEAFELAKTKQIFIKPYEIKAFPATILDGANYSYLNNVPRDTKVFCYEPFNSPIWSEWRCYIHNNQLVDVRNYSGEFKSLPYLGGIPNLIKSNKDLGFPNTYTIDIAELENLKQVVVEYNDMWAIGNYGVPNDLYLEMLKTRYFDIMKMSTDNS
jgi:hypothetical protein